MTKKRVLYEIPESFAGKPIKLDIGSGSPGWQQTPVEDWLHLDGEPCEHVEIVTDFATIPLPDKSVDEIFIGDVIEHVPMWRYPEVLSEWNRVLKPNAVIRGRCPNVDRAMKDYANGSLSLRDALLSIYGWGDRPNQQHYQGFTKETLKQLLLEYGIEINDFSGSPGPQDRPWWLVFSGKKVRDI